MPESQMSDQYIGATVTFEKATPKSSLYIQIWGSYSGQSLRIKLDVKSDSLFRGKEPLLGAQAIFPPSHPYITQFEHNFFLSIRHTFPEYSVTDISLQVVDTMQTILFFVFCLCFCLLFFLHESCSLCCSFLALLPPSLQLLCAQQVLPPG